MNEWMLMRPETPSCITWASFPPDTPCRSSSRINRWYFHFIDHSWHWNISTEVSGNLRRVRQVHVIIFDRVISCTMNTAEMNFICTFLHRCLQYICPLHTKHNETRCIYWLLVNWFNIINTVTQQQRNTIFSVMTSVNNQCEWERRLSHILASNDSDAMNSRHKICRRVY